MSKPLSWYGARTWFVWAALALFCGAALGYRRRSAAMVRIGGPAYLPCGPWGG